MKKKILFLINSLRVGGAEKILVDTLKGFDYDKYDVSLIYFIKGGVYLNDLPEQVKCKCVVGMGSRLDNMFRLVLEKFNMLDKYYRWCITRNVENYDTIVSYLEGFPTRMHSFVMDKGQRNITFVHTDLETFRDSSMQFDADCTQEKVYSRMDEIVFVSRHARESFERIYPKCNVKLTVLTNFIDINNVYQLSTKYKVENKAFSIVTVGRLAPVKGADIIPLVAKYIKEQNKDIHFTIVGDGSEFDNVKELIKDNDVDDCVTMVGFKKNPYPYILASDIYLNTSHTEGMPLSLCEAMTLGRPVIATKTSGAVELLGQENGILVERNVKDIADAIIDLYSNPKKRFKIAESGVSFSSEFERKKYLHKFYRLI